MSIWKDKLLGSGIGTATPAPMFPAKTYEDIHREFEAAIAAQAGNTPRKAFPPMWIDTYGNVTLLGQLMIRLHKGNVGVTADTLVKSYYKGVEIIDVRQHQDEVHVYVAIKDKPPFSLKDDANLFPSDGLLTQFRTLAGG